MAVAAGVLLLTSGCVSRTGEPSAAPTTTTATSPSTALTADPTIATEAAEILSNGDAAGFNARICPGTPHVRPVTTIGADYAHTMSAGVDTYYLMTAGDSVVARLSVRTGRDLVLILGLNYNTHEWCVYAYEWCPYDASRLPPFTAIRDDTFADAERGMLCGR